MADSETRAAGEISLTRAEFNVMVSVGLVALGMVFLWASGTANVLWTTLLLAVAGIVAIGAGMLTANDRLVRWLGLDPPWRIGVWFLLAVAVGVVLLYIAVRANSGVIAVLGVVVFLAGVIGLHVWWALRGGDESAIKLWSGVELIVVGVGLIWALDRFTGFAWLGLLVGFVGLLKVKRTIGAVLANGVTDLRRTNRLALDIAALGVLAVFGGTGTSNQLAVMGGTAAVFVGLSVFGLAMMYVRMSQRQAVYVLVAGLVMVVLGLLWARAVFGFWGLASVLGILVVGFGAWFVLRGEGIILIVLVGFIVVWGLADSPSDVAADPNPTGELQVLALGDSFISGEGAPSYLAGTNRVGRDRNECRRAPTAHPYLLAESIGLSLRFVACSGAKTEDLFTCGQMASGSDRCREPDEWEAAEAGESAPAGARPQLLNFDQAELDEFDLVLLSIGGNDVGFSTIIRACLLPRSCDERSEAWFANVEALGDTLTDTYQQVRAAVPIDTPVVVVPYPQLVDLDTCNLGLDEAEHAFVVDFVDRLDDRIEASAAEAGVHVYTSARQALAGHRLCDDEPGVHHLRLDPPNGSPSARYLPSTWIHNSMHPNPLGHELLAGSDGTPGLESFVRHLLAGGVPGEPANPESASEAAARAAAEAEAAAETVEETSEPAEVPLEELATDDALPADVAVDAVEADVLLSDGQWITDELYRTIRAILGPALLMLLGAVAFAIGFVNLEWFLSELVRPSGTWRNRAGEA